MYIYIYIQGVPGGKDLTPGGCSLGQTIYIYIYIPVQVRLVVKADSQIQVSSCHRRETSVSTNKTLCLICV